MKEQKTDEKEFFESTNSKADEKNVDLIDILRKIIVVRRILYKAAGIGLIIGFIIALSVPRQYTVKVTLSPEMGNAKGGNGLMGIAASFLGNGVTMGDGIDALNASLSADIVASTPFLLELLSMKVAYPNRNNIITLNEYLDEQSSPWWNYVIGMPGKMIDGIKLLLGSEEATINKKEGGAIELTKKESEKINILKKNILATMDSKTAITSISVTLQDSKVTAIVADSVIHKLQEYITNYRTFKAKEDCRYLEKLFEERRAEYYIAQRKYADYVDTHDNLILQSVRTEQERLQNDMNLAYQVYSQVANQLEVARAKVQEEKPVFAVVEPAVVPLKTSGIGKKMYIILSMFIAFFGTMGWLLLGKGLMRNLKDELKQ
jgi:hypothetical protein